MVPTRQLQHSSSDGFRVKHGGTEEAARFKKHGRNRAMASAEEAERFKHRSVVGYRSDSVHKYQVFMSSKSNLRDAITCLSHFDVTTYL